MGRNQRHRKFHRTLSAWNVFFDLDSDGFAEVIGWVAPREWLMALRDVKRNSVSDTNEHTANDITNISLIERGSGSFLCR